MAEGTTLIHYDTVELPKTSIEDGGTQIRSQIRLISTIGMLTVLKGAVLRGGYKLNADLIAEVRVEDDRYVVVEYKVDEYGIGDSMHDAQQDLLDSLVDYITSLERRENRLGDRERDNLQVLRNILTR